MSCLVYFLTVNPSVISYIFMIYKQGSLLNDPS